MYFRAIRRPNWQSREGQVSHVVGRGKVSMGGGMWREGGVLGQSRLGGEVVELVSAVILADGCLDLGCLALQETDAISVSTFIKDNRDDVIKY